MTTATRAAAQTDLSKLHPEFFQAPRSPQLVDLPEAAYLGLEGAGAPEEALPPAISAMYSIAYGLKFRLKRLGQDFKVCPVQAQWWHVDAAGNESPDISAAPPQQWRWRLLLMVPDFVGAADVEAIKQGARSANPTVNGIELIRFREGLAVQVMHFGPYDAETPTIEAMQAFMKRERLEPAGRHHEIYLGDPRRAKPEKLRTLLRQPVRAAASD